jgi:peptidyl-dipeptidase Dcp
MTSADSNPLLQPWDTPYGLPPFDRIRAEHFPPAFEAARAAHLAEIEAIAAQADAPSFENTIAALDRSGRAYYRVEGVFHNLAASETSPALQQVERELAPKLAAHSNAIYMHRGLFARIDALHARRDELGLTSEQRRLLDRFHFDFVRSGARIAGAAQQRYGQVMERLAELTTRFGQNVLADESAYRLVLREESELAGLPDFVRAAARQAALERGLPDAHVITLSRSLIVPFLTFSDRRDLREQAWRAWTSRGEHDGATDNRPVAREILSCATSRRALHGYASYADYALADTMAGTQAAVASCCSRCGTRAQARVEERERAAGAGASRGEAPRCPRGLGLALLRREGARSPLCARRIGGQAYFPLDRMVAAAFDCAGRLFGLSFERGRKSASTTRTSRPTRCEAATAAQIGVFLHDNFARPSKRSGAWMSALRWQTRNGAAARRRSSSTTTTSPRARPASRRC